MHAILERNRAALCERLALAARRACRDPDDVRLVAVTKSQPPHVAAALAQIGQVDLADNRLEGLLEKRDALEQRGLKARWHFVGRLQRNKARRVLQAADEIHSVDRASLLDSLATMAAEEARQPSIYLQVELAGDGKKAGFSEDELAPAVERAAEAGHLALTGLMTMAALPSDGEPGARESAARDSFSRLRELADSLPAEAFEGGRPRLSMGMSGDFELAIAEGATDVRLGRALFKDLEAGAPPSHGGAR